MATSAAGRNRAVPYINVTPLIDVLLVVLIIFMVVTPLKPSRFKADIPTQRDPNEDVSKLKPNPLTLVVSISTDLHTDSMNAGMKDILNVMSKFLNLGVPLEDIVARTTWNPAREIPTVVRGASEREAGQERERRREPTSALTRPHR